jgi:hypothetical protein
MPSRGPPGKNNPRSDSGYFQGRDRRQRKRSQPSKGILLHAIYHSGQIAIVLSMLQSRAR